jgi:perosamine synthetase
MNDKITWWRTSVGDEARDRVISTIGAENFSDGPVTRALEREFATALGVPHALLVPSGSAALLLALLACDVGPGDEVIVPDVTWVATAHAAALLGAKVRLVDTRPDLPLMDVTLVEPLIGPKTRVIMPVHLNGRQVDMVALVALAARHGVRIVEDAAQAIFSKAAAGKAGTIGDIGCYSLGMTKLISTGQGGLVVTRDAALHDKLHAAKYHGVTTDHEGIETYSSLGFNFKFNDVAAAVGFDQVLNADDRIAAVCRIYEAYEDGLANLPHLRLLAVDLAAGEVPLWTEIRTPHREALYHYLAQRGIMTRRLHPPLHLAPHLSDDQSRFPCAIKLSAEGLCLPCGPAQSMSNVERVIETLRSWRPLA